MTTKFDYGRIRTVNFGVSLKSGDGPRFFEVEIGPDIQAVFVENLNDTIHNIHQYTPEPFDPGQLYGSHAYIYINTSNPLASTARQLFNLDDLDVSAKALDNPDDVEYYFAIFFDANESKVVAVKRAQQFKINVRSRGRLVQQVDGTLRTVQDDIFKIDRDFDFIIDPDNIHIYRPTAFNLIGEVDEAVFAAAEANLQKVGDKVKFLDLSQLDTIVTQRKRAAKYIASISMRQDLDRFTSERIKQEAQRAKVEFIEEGDHLRPAEGYEVAFLEFLDSRRFQHRFTDDEDEVYVAPNRRRLE